MSYRSSWMTEELDIFRDQFRRFLAADLAPRAEGWRNQPSGRPRRPGSRSARWARCRRASRNLMAASAARFAFEAAVTRTSSRSCRSSTPGVSVHSDIVAPYLIAYGSEEQKQRWLPRMASGEIDRRHRHDRARRRLRPAGLRTTAGQGNAYVFNGQKTFISNGQRRPLIVAARTGDAGGRASRYSWSNRTRKVPARPQPQQDRPARLGHRRAVLRECARTGGEPARRRGGPGLRAADGAVAAGAADRAVGSVAAIERALG